MKNHILSLLRFNEKANLRLLDIIRTLPDKEESIKFFSHLITAQEKWLNRITNERDDSELTWFGPIFPEEELASRYKQSIEKWTIMVESMDDTRLDSWVVFARPADGKKFKVKIKDLLLQINFHSIHHRAQINRIIRLQGITPPATDYILSVLEEA